MPIKSSFASIADQVILLNSNLVNALSSIQQLTATSSQSIQFNWADVSGISSTFTLPSVGYLQSQINVMNRSLNSLLNITNTGSVVVNTGGENNFQKVITVDLNLEPNDLSTLSVPNTFQSQPNSFFDGLLNPQMFLEINLSGQVDNTEVNSCLVRRYIVPFEQNTDGSYTQNGQSAINNFNSLYRNVNNIVLSDFETWYQTTPGVNNPTELQYFQNIVDFDPNNLQYNGIFSVLSTVEDTLNQKLWYVLDTLQYVDLTTNQPKTLSIGDNVIINVSPSSTIYQVIEISTSSSNPQVRFQQVEGLQAIPIGVGTLKFYSPVVYSSTLNVNIGYNEHTVVFIKPLNNINYLLSKDWSPGIGLWTNDLSLNSTDSNNGNTLEQFYIGNVQDYGLTLQDLLAKTIPTILGQTPTAPTLNSSNFQVLQTNTQATNTANTSNLKTKNSQKTQLMSEINQLNTSIQNQTKLIQITRFSSDASKQTAQNDLINLTNQKNSKSQLLTTTTNDLINLSNQPQNNISPKFEVKGYFDIPAPIISNGTDPQNVIQFNVQYRKLAIDGTVPPTATIAIAGSNANTSSTPTTQAAFSNWINVTTPSLQRQYNPSTNQYTWIQPDPTNADQPNINTISISIDVNESIEIRVQSISEVGWPTSPLTSPWSTSIIIPFPDSLSNVASQTDTIVKQAYQTDLMNQVNSNLTAKGLDTHLADQTTLNNITFLHKSDNLLSGFKDANGLVVSLFDYLAQLTTRITTLEESINSAQGILQVSIFRNNDQVIVQNNSSITYTVECENYLDPFTGNGIPTGRVYQNNIYVIKEFMLQVVNLAASSPLGLLSNYTYLNNVGVYNTSVPQTFWIDTTDELLMDNTSGISLTQEDNQFLWMVNYDSVNSTTVTALSNNISNSFVSNNNNSITNTLSSTQLNVGYSDPSILAFVGNNNSLLDNSKWIDITTSISSSTKLLSTIHPVIKDFSYITQTNQQKLQTVNPGTNNAVNIPINIYFKMNALDNTQTGLNYQYVNLNGSTSTVKHIKSLKFSLNNKADNTPFEFQVTFTLNRSKVAVTKTSVATPTLVTSN